MGAVDQNTQGKPFQKGDIKTDRQMILGSQAQRCRGNGTKGSEEEWAWRVERIRGPGKARYDGNIRKEQDMSLESWDLKDAGPCR